VEKVAAIAGSDTALRHLRVCTALLNLRTGNQALEGAYNCGSCEKCVRTMINLEITGKLAQCRTFRRPLDARSIRRLQMTADYRGFYVENLAALRELGIRPDLQRALAYVLRRPSWLNGPRARRRIYKLQKGLRPRRLLRKLRKRLMPRRLLG
jgi:hypothetical protein